MIFMILVYRPPVWHDLSDFGTLAIVCTIFMSWYIGLQSGTIFMQGAHPSGKSQGNLVFLQGHGKSGNSVKWSGKLENLQKSGKSRGILKSCLVNPSKIKQTNMR